jgi:hypothetical protein
MTTTLSHTIRVHSPVVHGDPALPVDLAPRAVAVEGARLLLVDNGKPRARDLLGMLGEEMQELLPIASVEMISKPSAASPLADEEAAEIAGRVDLVITGLGDCGACSACSLHDALLFEGCGVPATVLVTDVFVSHVARFAVNLGAPGYHSLVVPHPVATKTDDQLRHLALSVAPAARAQLTSQGASALR